jgi:hypothetical protein
VAAAAAKNRKMVGEAAVRKLYERQAFCARLNQSTKARRTASKRFWPAKSR